MLIAPVVNLNGTSRDALVDQHVAAALSLEKALAALIETAPHPRDFQTVKQEQYRQARAQYEDRVRRLHEIIKEVESIGTQIYEQE